MINCDGYQSARSKTKIINAKVTVDVDKLQMDNEKVIRQSPSQPKF
jgi:hypothetical protein